VAQPLALSVAGTVQAKEETTESRPNPTAAVPQQVQAQVQVAAPDEEDDWDNCTTDYPGKARQFVPFQLPEFVPSTSQM
jgi:hypothetical protein